MTKLSPELMEPSGRKATGKKWLAKVSRHCPEVRWISHHALLGQYDFMDIYEAPDVETAYRVSHISRSEGAVAAESWLAIPYDRYIDLIEGVDE
jgi:uncharacterized protein with GYD domain